MKKKLVSCLIIIIQLFIAYQILKGTNSIIETVNFSINIWKNNIFPALFPFFVLSEILINYGFVEFVSELFKPLMQKLFKIKGETAFIFMMSIISGFPSSAKYTKELYKNGLINEYEASKILTFTHFSNPLFILGTVSLLFLNNKEAGLLILIAHYSTNIILGLIFRNYYPSTNVNNKVSLKTAITNMHNHRLNNPLNFGQIITSSIKNTINTLMIILGTITTFLVLTTIIDNVISINNYNQSILNGFFEMTQGLKYVSVLNIPLRLKATISAMIISFGGLSVHMQVISIISDTKIKYIPFLTARILHAVIASFIVYILFDWWIMIH
jgi:sporulation integral membrane protein YlbJ